MPPDQVVSSVTVPSTPPPAAPTTPAPSTQATPAEIPASISHDEGVAALDRLRERKSAAIAAPATETAAAQPPPEQRQIVEPPAEDDTDEEEVPVEGVVDELDEEPTPEEGETGPVAFHLDDGTPISPEEAKKGYLRREDYSHKTEVVKELQSNAQTRIQILDQSAEFMAARLPYVMEVIKASIPAEPDEALRATDPGKYWDQYNIRRVKLGELQQLETGFAQFKEAREQERSIQAQEKFIQESEKLLDKLPSWKNPKVAAKERAKVVAYGRKMGYSDAELATIDHRGILVIRDAMLGARVRAAGGKNIGKPNPTIPGGKTSGIGAPKATTVPAASALPRIDPNASSKTRFQQGVKLLAARRPH